MLSVVRNESPVDRLEGHSLNLAGFSESPLTQSPQRSPSDMLGKQKLEQARSALKLNIMRVGEESQMSQSPTRRLDSVKAADGEPPTETKKPVFTMKLNSKKGDGAQLIQLIEVEDDPWEANDGKPKPVEVRPALPKLNLKANNDLRLPNIGQSDSASDQGWENSPSARKQLPLKSPRDSAALQLDFSHDEAQHSESDSSDEGEGLPRRAPMMRKGNYTPRVGLSVQEKFRRSSFRKVSQRDLLEKDVGFTKYFTKVINQEDSKFYTPRDSKRFFALPLPK